MVQFLDLLSEAEPQQNLQVKGTTTIDMATSLATCLNEFFCMMDIHNGKCSNVTQFHQATPICFSSPARLLWRHPLPQHPTSLFASAELVHILLEVWGEKLRVHYLLHTTVPVVY